MNKFNIISLVLLCFTLSCNSVVNNQTADKSIPVTSSNPKAIEFYRKAQDNLFNQEFSESKSNFLNALRLDPNFILANLQINESNSLVRLNFIEKARNQIEKGNDYEKLYLNFIDTNDKEEKRKIANNIIQKYPNYVEGYLLLIQTFNNNQEREKGVKKLEELIKKFPNNAQIYYQYIRFKYSGNQNTIALKRDVNFYNEFLDFSDIVYNKFPNSLRILSQLGQIFRNSINFDDATRPEKALSFYQKAQEIVNETGSSQKIQLTRNIGRTYLSFGNLDDALPYFNEAIKLSNNSGQKVESYFDLILAYLYDGNYFETIKLIESFEKNLSTFGLTEEDILKAKVGIYNYKAIIYAHANQKDRALNSYQKYVQLSNDLINYYGFTGSDIEIKESIQKLIGSNISRYRSSSPDAQLWTKIWISILTGDFDLGLQLIKTHNTNFNSNLPYFLGQLNIMRGNIDKGYDILKNNSFGYFQYFKAQALIGMGKPLVAKQVLDSVRQLPAGSIFTSLVSKKAKLLHENL